MQVVVPFVVPDELGEGVRLAQHGVDEIDGLVLGGPPEIFQARPQRPDVREFPIVTGPLTGPAPRRDEGVEGGDVRQVLTAVRGVDQRGRSVQRNLGVMSKNNLDSLRRGR
jgi:hypothetical protein